MRFRESTARTVLAVLFAAALAVSPAFADNPWDKHPTQWTKADCFRILRDSPWAPAKLDVQFSIYQRKEDLLTHLPTDSPIRSTPAGPVAKAEIGSRPLPAVSVIWWSSRTVRWAQQRLRQLDGLLPVNATLTAPSLEDFVIIIEGSKPLRILMDAEAELKDSVYLELPGAIPIEPREVRFHVGEKAGEDYAAFHFARYEGAGQRLSPGTEQVIFHCKAKAKKSEPNRPNELSIRTVFAPRKMRSSGSPDL